MTTDMSGTGPSAYPIVVLRRLTEDDFASIPDESDDNFELERKEVETETRMIITRELIFDRIGKILQEKLESTLNWSSCEEYFNPDRSLVSKNTNLKWPSRLKTLQLLKRKVVIALWNIMKEEKRNVKGKTRLEVAFEIARIFISPKFIKNRFQWQIVMNASGEITESMNPDCNCERLVYSILQFQASFVVLGKLGRTSCRTYMIYGYVVKLTIIYTTISIINYPYLWAIVPKLNFIRMSNK